MPNELKHHVFEANRAMSAGGLAFRAWGSVSGINRDAGLVAITPAGGAGGVGGPDDLAVIEQSGSPAPGTTTQPSKDAPLHLAIFRKLSGADAVAVSHGPYSTAWAQARKSIPVFGTTHAEVMPRPVVCTDIPTAEQVAAGYEDAIAENIAASVGATQPGQSGGVLVAGLGLVTFGASPAEAIEHAERVEHVAHLAALTTDIEPYPKSIPQELLNFRGARTQADADDEAAS